MAVNSQLQKKNEEDFERITQNIHAALEKLRASRSLSATQEKLSELAGCSRKTLENRGWPLQELKRIKEQRKVNRETREHPAKDQLSVENRLKREQLLIQRVENLQDQNAKLFDQVQRLEEKLEDARRLFEVQDRDFTFVKEEKRKLENELRRLKREDSGSNVIQMNPLE